MDRIRRGSQICKEDQDTVSASFRAATWHGRCCGTTLQRKRPIARDRAAADEQPTGICGIRAQPAAIARTYNMDHAHLVPCEHRQSKNSDIRLI